MNAKRNEITRLLESFAPPAGNPIVLIASFEDRLTEHSIEAIRRAVNRYCDGDVPGQSTKFAPTVPEFVQEVRKCQEFIDLASRPRLPAPAGYRRGTLCPFEISRQKALSANAHLPVLFEDVSNDTWRRLSVEKQVPPGSKWVASLGIVFGPEPRASIEGRAA